ncbi:MAG: hypothetical protein E7678_03185 [Ruminococcaceae bacterium]|nr:hypothetical protein [Oscillospiraceae bacterium]
MNHEIDMICFGEGDLELIDKCSDLLDELAPNPMSNEEFMNIIRKTEKERITVIEDDTSYKNVPKTRFILKRIAIVAAAVVILLASTVAVAAAFGVNVFDEINKIIRQEDNARTDIEGFTFHNGGEAKYYSSIEQFIEEKSWDILYPSKFPENVKIDNIRLNKSSRENDKIRIFTNNEKIRIKIEKKVPEVNWNESALGEQESVYETNGIRFLIFPDDDSFFAACYYNGDYYSIQANDYANLVLIIDNLKK